ncbi:hypothetical protein RclHR1_00300035 [Rhizophagus clarus]|uniref:Uncharacterized protein n=1 Tax=Rhizophagus clarus TaxID=94130 RepID=A0A2Z6RZQ3_9GLOM|nr:hypothetical protein RclHR1_00300035 [Rhizophagus clarus]
MAETNDIELYSALQGSRRDDSFRPHRKDDSLTQFSTSSDYYDIRCLQRSLDLRASTLQQTNSGRTDQISRRKPGSLGQSNKKHATGREVASSNGERDILERNFEKKGEGCEIYLRCINPMLNTNECGVIDIKSEQYEDVEMGRGQGFKQKGKTRVQTQIGELLRIGVLGGMEWTTEFPSENCRFVHAHNQPQGFNNEGSMFVMPACTRNDKEKSKYNDTHYTLVDTFKNKSQQHKIATSIGREDLIDIESDPKKLDYYIASVAEFGFNHIIIIGEVDYGMLFLDCYGRVFLWEDMNQFIYPLANSLEEIPKRINEEKEKDLAWFVKDGIVYEYFMEPGISARKKTRNLKKKKNTKK